MTIHTVRVPHRKKTRQMSAVIMPTPPYVILPTSMHIGAPSKILVAVGDAVSVGQPIAEPSAFVSSYIYAPISGTVKSISKIRLSNGNLSDAVTIVSDGENRYYEKINPPIVNSFESFIDAVRLSGAVGLGGAGFPTSVKLSPSDLKALDTVIVNGAECEPYITSDTRTMIDGAADLAEGIGLLQTYLGVRKIIVGIEDNKPECADALRPLLPEGARIQMLPARYPQGGEKTLIYNTLHRTVPERKLPIDVGVIVINCTTLAFIARYIRTGMPLVRKCVTVDGDAVKNPMNVSVPIGTPLSEVFAFTGGFAKEPAKILYGGPMMGITVPDMNRPILKNTNAVLAFTEKGAALRAPSACIRCGRCVTHCPMNLLPTEINAAYAEKDFDTLVKLKVNLCIECGACSYSCPASRPITELNRLAKRYVAEMQEKRKKETK